MKTTALFWDASAIVPLLIEEECSPVICKLWSDGLVPHAWEWAFVEVDAALTRRGANSAIWQDWRNIQLSFRLYSFPGDDLRSLRMMNRTLGLRAADAGHIFLFHSLVHEIQGLQLITFDKEMVTAAQQLSLPLHPACIQS